MRGLRHRSAGRGDSADARPRRPILRALAASSRGERRWRAGRRPGRRRLGYAAAMLCPVAIHSDAGPIVEDGQLDFTDATATPVVPGITTAPDGAYVDIAWQVVSTADGTVFNLTD